MPKEIIKYFLEYILFVFTYKQLHSLAFFFFIITFIVQLNLTLYIQLIHFIIKLDFTENYNNYYKIYWLDKERCIITFLSDKT